MLYPEAVKTGDASSNEHHAPSRGEAWKDLALKAQKGDKAAYSALLRDIAPFVRGVLWRSLAQPDWADDITQDVLISVHKSLHTYGADRPFRPWLMAIVNFRRTDYLRKHYGGRRHLRTSLDDADFVRTYVTDPVHAGEYGDMERAVGSLPEQQRRAFQMVKVEGRSAQEAASALGISVSAVKVAAHRAVKKLRKILE